MSFVIRATVICDTCHLPMSYDLNEDGTATVVHPHNDCARSDQKFNPPVVELVQL